MRRWSLFCDPDSLRILKKRCELKSEKFQTWANLLSEFQNWVSAIENYENVCVYLDMSAVSKKSVTDIMKSLEEKNVIRIMNRGEDDLHLLDTAENPDSGNYCRTK